MRRIHAPLKDQSEKATAESVVRAFEPKTASGTLLPISVNGRTLLLSERVLCASAASLGTAMGGYVCPADYAEAVAVTLAALEMDGIVTISFEA